MKNTYWVQIIETAEDEDILFDKEIKDEGNIIGELTNYYNDVNNDIDDGGFNAVICINNKIVNSTYEDAENTLNEEIDLAINKGEMALIDISMKSESLREWYKSTTFKLFLSSDAASKYISKMQKDEDYTAI